MSPVFEVKALSAPDVPQNFTATQGVGRVRLAWAAPESDGGSPIIRYEYRHEAGTPVPSSTNWTPAGTAQSVTVTGLMGGTEYTFEVRAVNSIDNGQPATASARTVVTENTLVSNLAQPDSGSFVKIRHRPDTLPDDYITGPKRLAQNFTTGANTSGYTLDGIDIRAAVRTLAHHSQDLDFDVSLCPVKDQNQSPGAGCSELTRPETFDARSRLNFQAPADLTLAANTTYAVVLSGYGDIANTASDAEDTPATPGWSIGNSYHTFIIWSTDEPNKGYWHSNRYSLAIPFAIRAVAMSGQQAADPPTITAPPSVSESGADGQWTPGQTVQATVTFSEAVAVDTSGGTPTITLTPGATGQKSASYTSGGGTEALVFAYTLSEDDGTHTAMGVAPDSLALNGGSITSEATGVNADLSHNGTLIMGTIEDTSTSDDGSVAKGDPEGNGPVVRASNHAAAGIPIIAGTVQVGETLSVDTSGISDTDGIVNSILTYQWIANDGTEDTAIQDAIGSTYTLASADEGKTIKVQVSFTDDAGNDESLTSEATAAVAARPNSAATGAPTISGTAQVGQMLTASTSGISDSDGLADATFTYQWIANDGTEDTAIQDAIGSTYTLASADEGKTIKVQVSFTDDGGNQETRTSAVTVAVAAAPTPLTAATHDAPGSHNGQEKFTFELRFSEELGTGFSYKTLRDYAFTVTRGTVAGARRLDGDSDTPNIRWEISVTPDSTADVTVELPITTDCEAQGAICTEDGRVLSSPLKFTVKGPPMTASFESVPTAHNGSDSFRIRIAFSEEPKSGFSYTTMGDHAFTVTGGSVTGARRLVSGKNLRWEIVVSPDSNGDVTITLPATTDCDAQAAICADGDKKLSSRLERTVSGPG